jgi:hypothetical protein
MGKRSWICSSALPQSVLLVVFSSIGHARGGVVHTPAACMANRALFRLKG